MTVEYVTPSVWLAYMEDKTFLTGQLGPVHVEVYDENGYHTGEFRWQSTEGTDVDADARCCLGHYVDVSGLEDVDYSVGMLEAELHVPVDHWLIQPATEAMVRWVQARVPYHWVPFTFYPEIDVHDEDTDEKVHETNYTLRHPLPVVQDLLAHINDQLVTYPVNRDRVRRLRLRGFIATFLVPRFG